MKIKAFVLIFLAAFAIVASTTFEELSNRTQIEKCIDNNNPFRVVPIDNNGTVDLQREIDTPGMPG